MRRKTLKPNTEIVRNSDTKRHRTFVGRSPNFNKQTDEIQLKNHFRFAQSIVNHFINEILFTKCAQELNKRQLKKLINLAMNHCNIYLQNQTLQLDPNRPHQQKKYQTSLQPDPEPQCRIFDPMLSFPNHKSSTKLQSQNSISLSSLKKKSTKVDQKSLFIHQNDNRNSGRSNTSRLSKANFSFQNPKLIPLRFENGITPQLSTRRTLQDFLRQKKINADVNLGYKIRNFSQEKQNLKTIVQFPKSGFFMNTTRNFQASNQTEMKLPQISLKEDLNTDYDGNMINIKKTSNLKKTTQILKLVCKVKQQNHEKNKNDIQSKYFRPQHIKLKPINSRKDSINSNAFTMRFEAQDDIKSLVQNGLYTNRIKFRQQAQSQHKQIDPSNQIHQVHKKS